MSDEKARLEELRRFAEDVIREAGIEAFRYYGCGDPSVNVRNR
ncbi:hypothetical protein [Desulfoglaeba alkanexedens]|nr:hypothetical protein [Desulfoglaeba alkanexedens]